MAKEKLDFEGKFWKLKNAFLQIKPKRNPIPIYFAANGRKTREITGKLADGWLPVSQGPEIYRKHLEEIRKFAEKLEEISKILSQEYTFTLR